MVINAKVYPTNNCLFITKQKVASTLLASLFDNSEKDASTFEYSIDIVNKKIIEVEYPLSVISKKVVQDFDDIFSNNSKKTVIILYRKPDIRLKSSIIEDFISSILSDYNNEFAIYMLNKMFSISSNTVSFLNDSKNEFHLAPLNYNNNELIDYLKNVFTLYMEYLTETGFNNPHAVNYLSEFYVMINENIFDTSKLILCDIDSKLLNPLLERFSLNVDYHHTHSNSEYYPIIDAILSDVNNKHIVEKYNEKIKSENVFYELLKKHSNNFNMEK
jgi:hypothetical protein